MLPKYDPCKGNTSSCKFIERVEQLMNGYVWNESTVLFAVQSNMKWVAKMWVDAQNVFNC